ncbi:MAG: HD domain-containing protein [archaeon]
MGDIDIVTEVGFDLERLNFDKEQKSLLLEKVDIVADICDNGKTLRHSVNVARTFRDVAGEYGLNESLCYASGILHDIGKFIIDPYVLNFEGKYTDEMYKEMERHVDSAVLSNLLGDDLRFYRDVARRHHCSQEHRSYPKGFMNNLYGEYGEMVWRYALGLAKNDFEDAMNRNDGGVSSGLSEERQYNILDNSWKPLDILCNLKRLD